MIFEQDKFKADYENVVFTYNSKLLTYAKMLCYNKDNAEELAQETLLTGYKYYGSLNDKQKVFPWLKTIAKRLYLRKFCDNNYDFFASASISMDAPVFNGSDLTVADTIIDDGIDIEENFVQNELCSRILNEIGSLSKKQKDSVISRYFYGFSVKETAASLKMTDNSVKVSSHIGIEKVKERLKNYFIEGDYIMNCKEAYAYLHQYAKGRISEHSKEEVEKHINICKDCRDIAQSLTELEKYISKNPAQEKEHRNYVAHVQLQDYSLEYVTVFMDVERYKDINAKIDEWGGEVPFESMDLKFPGFLAAGFKFIVSDYMATELLAIFGDDGFRWGMDEVERNDFIIAYRLTKINKLHNPNEFSIVFLKNERKLRPSIEHPDLIHGYAKNYARRDCGTKLGVYLAVPSNGKNLRIKQGDGIIDCGAYKFIYADRHVLGDESVVVNCSYIK